MAVGYRALRCNTQGGNNIAIGSNVAMSATIASNNVIIGEVAACTMTSGDLNVVIGHQAGRNMTTGCCITAVGQASACSITVNNVIAVGQGANPSNTAGHTVWGNSGNNVCNCVYAAWSNVSDCRDKTNIKSLGSKFGLALINKLRPVSFNWDHRDTYVRECKYEYGHKDGNLAGSKEHYGLIAQELKSAIDDLDIKFDGLGHDDDKDAYRLTY